MTIAARSARSRLLRRGRRDGERAQLALELAGVEASPGREPVARTQLEEALARPVGQDAEQVAQTGLGVEAVQASRGDQRHHHDDAAVRDLLCRPLDIPSLSAHAPEAERLVQESIDDAAGALGAATVRIPGPLRHAIIVRVGSFAELEKTSLRLVALASARNVTHAAARLGMAPVSLTRWLGRRSWLPPILNSLRECFDHPDV